jgi:hypothetical protein
MKLRAADRCCSGVGSSLGGAHLVQHLLRVALGEVAKVQRVAITPNSVPKSTMSSGAFHCAATTAKGFPWRPLIAIHVALPPKMVGR